MKKLNLNKLNACNEAKQWFSTQPSNKDAWYNCHRGDWMLWIANTLGLNTKKLILAEIQCIKTVYYLSVNNRSKEDAIATIDYGKNLMGKKEVQLTAGHYSIDAISNAIHNAAYNDIKNNTYNIVEVAYNTAISIAIIAANSINSTADNNITNALNAIRNIHIVASITENTTETAAYDAIFNDNYDSTEAILAVNAVIEEINAARLTYIYENVMIDHQKKTADICRKYLTSEIGYIFK